MKIKEQTRKLAAGCSKQCFESVDKTDEVSSKHCFEVADRLTKSVHIYTASKADVV
ncbi:chlorohydrolase [Streptococcus pneumoniae]|nr:chlorohydrolase [Streptococcus pneumoniae]